MNFLLLAKAQIELIHEGYLFNSVPFSEEHDIFEKMLLVDTSSYMAAAPTTISMRAVDSQTHPLGDRLSKCLLFVSVSHCSPEPFTVLHFIPFSNEKIA